MSAHISVNQRSDGYWQASYDVTIPTDGGPFGAGGTSCHFHDEAEARVWAEQQVASWEPYREVSS